MDPQMSVVVQNKRPAAAPEYRGSFVGCILLSLKDKDRTTSRGFYTNVTKPPENGTEIFPAVSRR
jgi:hypothetical protein